MLRDSREKNIRTIYLFLIYKPRVKIIYTLIKYVVISDVERLFKITVYSQRHLPSSSGTQWQKSIKEPN